MTAMNDHTTTMLCPETAACSMGAAGNLQLEPSKWPLEVALACKSGPEGAGDKERQGRLNGIPDGAGVVLLPGVETRYQFAEMAGIRRPDETGHRLTAATVRIHQDQQVRAAEEIEHLIR